MSEMTVADLRAAQDAEYGTYVAAEPINIGAARAFNIGDPVPKSHVENGVVQRSQVKEVEREPEQAPPPARNAGFDAWRDYALAQPGVTEESINGLTRDQLRDQFGSEGGK